MKLKLWTAVWSEKGREQMGIEDGDNPIISQDYEDHQLRVNVSKGNIGRPKMRDVELYPFFATKAEADVFIDGIDWWKAVSVEIEIPTN